MFGIEEFFATAAGLRGFLEALIPNNAPHVQLGLVASVPHG
jgi:hypothetical protein